MLFDQGLGFGLQPKMFWCSRVYSTHPESMVFNWLYAKPIKHGNYSPITFKNCSLLSCIGVILVMCLSFAVGR